jgi:23S rRNA (uridine2552-2'-O)-methyltransferase
MPRRVVKDTFYEKAKKEGFRARSIYKLEEMQQRFKLIRPGDRVLDLGAAPGSWLQAESAFAGARGLVVGLDILPISPFSGQNIVLRRGDIRTLDVGALLTGLSLPFFDVVTSDIAPSMTGIGDVDDAHMKDLYLAVVRVVTEGLRKGGNFVVKVFFSPEFRDMALDLRPLFSKVVVFKPKASRGVSAEVYLVCTGKV